MTARLEIQMERRKRGRDRAFARPGPEMRKPLSKGAFVKQMHYQVAAQHTTAAFRQQWPTGGRNG